MNLNLKFEKIPDYIVKFVIAGIIIFISITGALFVKDYLTYKLSLPHERYFTAKCKVVNNNTYVFIVTKSDIDKLVIKNLDGKVLHVSSFLTKDSEYPVKIRGKITEPLAIEYTVENLTKYAFVECEEEIQTQAVEKKSLLRTLLGI